MSYAIFGCGTLARLAYYYIYNEMGLKVDCFVIDKLNSDFNHKSFLFDVPIISWDNFINKYKAVDIKIHIALAYKNMRNKKDVFERIQGSGYELFNIVSNSAFISEDSIKGKNNFIMPNVVIEPYAEIGSNNIIWSNSTICHNTIIGNHNFLASNVTIGGKTNIGDLCFLGFSSTVSDHLKIENEVLIAANSFLNENVKSLCRVQGLPAKLHSKINKDQGIIFNNC